MGRLIFAINETLDGCCDHRAVAPDAQLMRWFIRLMDSAGAMLYGRVTYELMESAWPAVARDAKAPKAWRDWARKLEAKPKYVVSTTRRDFPWRNTYLVEGDLARAIKRLKKANPRGLLVGGRNLPLALARLGLIDEYRLVVHPILAGRGPKLFSGLPNPTRLKLVGTKRFASGALALRYLPA